MNCSTCLVLVIAFFTLLAHADETQTDKVGAATVTAKIDTEEVSVDGNKVTEENPVPPPTAAPAGDEDKEDKEDKVPARDEDKEDIVPAGDEEKEDNTPING